ncbi:hypothetical protein TERTU_4457 [Teredinibacter turnerae T7901]|uniref:Uncharacterized protein n=1 Tax=Teredinibacter turnerae (strain ATCC 39867 / T7901) TaxID=377629 RepID=C5BJ52_TERTT|nr:hypothetical protein [Teredinibacter turnerae]ACR11964.1 hypothetical protein TERTU_4457 [Teredinibacter turnerae T7901]
MEFENAVIIALVVFCLSVLFKGFLSAAGKDLWVFLKESLLQRMEKEMEVGPDFKAKVYPEQNCTWIPEENIQNKERHKWAYYPHPKNGKKCFRLVGEGKFTRKEYFMVTPNAKRT